MVVHHSDVWNMNVPKEQSRSAGLTQPSKLRQPTAELAQGGIEWLTAHWPHER
jgi:hypothetical protein